MAMIDYGAVLFVNGVQQNDEMFMDMPDGVCLDEEYFVYAGDKHIMLGFYKAMAVVYLDERRVAALWPDGRHKSRHLLVDGVDIHIKYISHRVAWARFSYRGMHYNVVFGYGIDPNWDVWNDIKVDYLGRSLARRVDKIYERIVRNEKTDAKNA